MQRLTLDWKSMNNNLPYYLTFSHFEGIGPTRLTQLISHFGTVKEAYEASPHEINQALGRDWGVRFTQFKNSFDPIKTLNEYQKRNITVLTLDQPQYPAPLRNIYDPPICLYVKGDIESYDFVQQKFFAIVGTRRTTDYGRQITRKFAQELSGYGFVVVSGMALGIDSCAHVGALDAGGQTIAFLGCGVDLPHPPSNTDLYNRIVSNSGLIMSEFPPGMMSLKGLFISRNRLISGLSQGVLIIEGLEDSGALITAKCALDQNREVFATPLPITSPTGAAPHKLIKSGEAKLVTCVEDILEELLIPAVSPKVIQNLHLKDEEKILYDCLYREIRSADGLAEDLQLPIHKVLSIVSSLELRDIIEKNREGKYQVKID